MANDSMWAGIQVAAIGSLFAIEREAAITAGGLAATAAVFARSLGAVGVPIGRIGMDRFGRDIERLLRDQGIDVHAVQTDSDLPTARWIQRGIMAKLEPYAAFDNLQWDAEVEALARSAEVIITDACGRRHGQSRSTGDRMLIAAPSAIRIIDLTHRPPTVGDTPKLDREQVGQAMELCSVMVVDSVALRALVPAATTVADGAKRLASSMRKGTVIAMANDREDGFVVSERGSEPIPRGGPGSRSGSETAVRAGLALAIGQPPHAALA
jgi:sugar/nucleoside kinase (ribokinase family)